MDAMDPAALWRTEYFFQRRRILHSTGHRFAYSLCRCAVADGCGTISNKAFQFHSDIP